MTNKECEKKLVDLMSEAYAVFKAMHPEGDHLSMFATNNGSCAMGYKTMDGKKKLLLDTFKTAYGTYRFSE